MTDGEATSPARRPRARGAARAAAVALALLAVWEVAAVLRAGATAPTDADWRAASAAVPATLRDDQLVVFAPRWLDPVGRRWFGGRLSLDQAARMDGTRYRDVWEVSVRGASAPEVAGRTGADEQQFGAVRVRHVTKTAPDVVWRPSDGLQICEIDFEPHRGLVLDLHHELSQAVQRFPAVTLGDRLQVYAGLADYKQRDVNRARGFLQVIVDGQPAAEVSLGNNSGWTPLPGITVTPGAHDVAFAARVQTPASPVALSVCVMAESWSGLR